MKQYRKFTKDVLTLALVTIFISLAQIVLLPLLTKNLGARDFGIWVSIILTADFLALVASLGLGSGIIRFFSRNNKNLRNKKDLFSILFLGVITGIFFSVLLFLLSNPIATYIFKDPSSYIFIRVASIMVFLATLNVLIVNYFNAIRKIYTYSSLLFLQSFIELLAVFYFILNGFGLGGAIIGSILSRLLVTIVGFILIKGNITFNLDFTRLKSYLIYSLPLAPLSFFFWIIHSSNSYIIGLFGGAANIGIYSFVYSLSKIMFLFMGPIGLILYPALSMAWDNKKFKEAKNYLSYSLKYFLLLAIPSIFGLTFLAKPLIKIIADNNFLGGAILFPLIAGGLMLYKIGEIFLYILTSKKETLKIFYIYGSGALFSLVLSFFLVYLYGIIGAAIATFATYLYIFIVMFFKSYIAFKFKIDYKFLVKSLIASVVMSIIIPLFNINNLFGLIKVIILGVVIYFAIILLTKAIKKEEMLFLYNSIIKKN
ncbi:MAG: lipopolysaccharide biosynthesis protein [Candidatus Woesearchaeota archaeon]|nr:MAG: lipopolysaccharide biosynthesis protein [Candidatus Woesearchaeota archaeon]